MSTVALNGQECGMQQLPPNARPPVEPSPIEQSKVQSSDELPIKEVSPGIFELATLRPDQNKRTITFPANISMHEGPIEHFLVTSRGNEDEKPMAPDQCFCTGSRDVNGIFSAGQSGAAVTVIDDDGAMVNYIASGFKNDEVCKANIPVRPPIAYPLKVNFSFTNQDEKASNWTQSQNLRS